MPKYTWLRSSKSRHEPAVGCRALPLVSSVTSFLTHTYTHTHKALVPTYSMSGGISENIS